MADPYAQGINYAIGRKSTGLLWLTPTRREKTERFHRPLGVAFG